MAHWNDTIEAVVSTVAVRPSAFCTRAVVISICQ